MILEDSIELAGITDLAHIVKMADYTQVKEEPLLIPRNKMKKLISKKLRDKLETICEFIYENEESFIRKFLEQEAELVSVSLHSTRIKFVAVLHSGAHIASDCFIKDVNKWASELCSH